MKKFLLLAIAVLLSGLRGRTELQAANSKRATDYRDSMAAQTAAAPSLGNENWCKCIRTSAGGPDSHRASAEL